MKVIYFSDGCASQYKNYKNFLNQMNHRDDFRLDAEWNFFAASHGENACDGVDGTIKRLAAHASLQQPQHKQILTPRQLYEFSRAKITGITSFYVCSENIQRNHSFLENKFSQGKTLPGTRSYHSSVALSSTQIRLCRISSEGEPNIVQRNDIAVDNQFNIDNIEAGSYIGCLYSSGSFCRKQSCKYKIYASEGTIKVFF